MAPKEALLKSALVDAAHEIFRANPDNLTVNAVRSYVEELLDLKAGFFKTNVWKSRSKELITATANKLLDVAESGGEEAAEESKEDQRNKNADKTKKTKKQKPARKASATGQDTLDIDDSSVSPAVKQPPQKRKLAKRNITVPSREKQGENGSDDVKETAEKGVDGDEGRLADDEEEPSARRKKAKLGEEASKPGTSSPLSAINSGSDVLGMESKSKQATAKADVAVDAGDVSDGSSTSVLDDTPPPKRKSKPSRQAAAKPVTQKATAATNSPDETEVKKLQSQLAKCGVRKIWGIELKRFGDDAKAKIRQLKSMLHDVGMDGRFSESKAREIKERRELMADLEEVQEMNRNWGVNGSGRAPRSRVAKGPKEESSEKVEEGGEGGDAEDSDEEVAVSGGSKSRSTGHGDSKEEDTDGDGDDGPKVKAKGRQSARQADLAFLGSDSESD